MGDVVSEVLPHLESFFSDHCLIVFPAGKEKELAVYYRDLVGEVSFSESQYFYSIRPKNGLAYSVLGTEQEFAAAIEKLYTPWRHCTDQQEQRSG
jgi:hypothetical protein